ncbi:Mariner Mos1 transposase [Eumeta japonica]|uniref:Mariner Mos1 transposase n=1 Tax=Eumeta variegata TaxID=151549 RepID=A0A4C1V298_EUMVA|nr:Mariner Mos1 transposase [Eumeta japonica]
MYKFEPNKRHLRELLIYFLNLKKSAAEAHRLLVEAYNEAALSERTCQLEELLEKDSSQTQKELVFTLEVTHQSVSHRLKSLGMIHKQAGCGVYELLNPSEAITGTLYRTQLMRSSLALNEKRPQYYSRHDKIILLHDNTSLHVTIPVKNYLKTLDWEVLPHPPYSLDIAPSDYHLFPSMAHALSEQRFTSYDDTENWVDSWITSKNKEFFRLGIRTSPEKWKKVIATDGQYFD